MLFFLFITVGVAQAQENRLGVNTDLTWSSLYMIDGFKVGGNKPVWQASIKTDIFNPDYALMFWTAIQADRSNKQYDEQDFFALYQHDFFRDEKYAFNLHGFYDYWVYPNTEPVRDEFGDTLSTSKRQGNKLHLGVSLPKLIPIEDTFLIPSYNVYYWAYWAWDRSDRYQGGIHHELLLESYHNINLFIPHATSQYVGATTSVNYNNGAFGVKPGWSHTTASLLTGVYALKSIFVMSLNHQWTLEPTVNDGNELWTTLSYIKKF
jgi:hypothetical protein